MSRAYNARRKAKRQEARAFVKPTPHARHFRRRRWMALVPALIITTTLAVVALVGFETTSGISKTQVDHEVIALLAGIPQHGATLGSPRAPITVEVFADLECPTVKRFVLSYLPSIIDRWVRDGSVKLEYRPLETDTLNEHTFFRQEVAALAAGKQDRMWHFILTFVHEQELEYTGYATDAFLTDIASQVPGLTWAQWRRDREDALLSKRVARSVYSAHARGYQSTPTLLVGLSAAAVNSTAFRGQLASKRKEVEASLAQVVASLGEEAARDNPALHSSELSERNEVKEFLQE